MGTQTLALVGATGGAGTTRLAVECGATLARAGRDVAVLDAAFGTQGLSEYVHGGIDADATALATEETDLESALYPVPIETPGRLSLCPARAPFERLARAKTAGAAEHFEKQIVAAALARDVVVVDTPPVASNQAVAAVDAVERVAVVTPDTTHGADALARMRARLADIGCDPDAVVANFASEEPTLSEADTHVPRGPTTEPEDCPSCLPPDETFAPAVAHATEVVVDAPIDLDFPEKGRLDGLFG